MKLTEHQEDRKQQIIQVLRDNIKRILLKGCAGVGKTTLTQELINEFRSNVKKFGTIWVTAPTHKALQVLRSKIKEENYITFATIHSGLKLIRKVDPKTGIESFIKKKYNPRFPALQGCVLLILDESSMLSCNLLNILEEPEFKNIPIIFAGDYRQINPVGEDHSPIFLLADLSEQYQLAIQNNNTELANALWEEARKMTPIDSKVIFDLKVLNYKTFELTEIVRQGKDNPIIDLSYSVHDNLNKLLSKQDSTFEGNKINRINIPEEELRAKVEELSTNPYQFMDDENKTYYEENIVYTGGYVYSNDRGKIIERLAEVNGSNELKYLAWANDNADKVNKEVRELIYGMNVKKVELNEIIVLKAPYGEFHNNEEVKINDVVECDYDFIMPNEHSRFTQDEGSIIINQTPLRTSEGKLVTNEKNEIIYNYDKLRLKVYRVLASSINRKESEQISGYMTILHEDSQKQYDDATKLVVGMCNKGMLSWLAKTFFVEQIANFKYNHALTAHTSQGSTYRKVIIDIGNINANKNIPEKKRLLYTAITRASELVILYNVK